MDVTKVLRKAAGVFVVAKEPGATGDDGDVSIDPTPAPAVPASPPVPQAAAPASVPAAQPAPQPFPRRPGLHERSQTQPVAQPARPPVVPAAAGPPLTLSFPTIYQAAQVPVQPFTAEQLIDMVASMPPELALDTRRRTVHGMLQAMSKTTGMAADGVVSDAMAKLAALSAHVDQQSRQATDHLTRLDTEMRSFEQQIAARRREADQINGQMAQLTQACRDEWFRLAQVLDFFGVSRPQER